MHAEPAATEAQTKFVTTLIAERVLTDAQRAAATAEVATLTKKRASIIISFLMAQPKAPAVKPVPANLVGLPKSRYALDTRDLVGLTGINADGNDTLFFEVKEYRGTVYMRRLIGAPGDFLRVRLNANDQGIVAGAIRADALKAAQRFGERFAVCGKCGAPLTDEESRRLSLGPICKGAFGL